MESSNCSTTSSHPAAAFTAGASTPIREVERALGRLAGADVNVLLHGESGTGKHVLAEALHAAGPRAAAPFLALSLGGRPEVQIERELFGEGGDNGLLAQARGATLYLGEVSALALRLQRRLARSLSVSDVRGTARVIATTTIELEEPVRQGRFLPELWIQLGLIRLTIPPLRERREDIPALADHVIGDWCARTGTRMPVLGRAAVNELVNHTWPGNVRELQQTIDAALTLTHGAELTAESIRSILSRRPDRRTPFDVFPLRALERDYIATVLVRCNWNQSLAARRLGIGRNTLMRKIRTFKLDRSQAA